MPVINVWWSRSLFYLILVEHSILLIIRCFFANSAPLISSTQYYADLSPISPVGLKQSSGSTVISLHDCRYLLEYLRVAFWVLSYFHYLLMIFLLLLRTQSTCCMRTICKFICIVLLLDDFHLSVRRLSADVDAACE